MTTATPDPKAWTARQVILGFVAFFVLLIAVQAAFITIAISTHTGVVSTQPYRKGLNYGDRIAFADAQEKRGWQETFTLSPDQNQLTFRLAEKDGTAIPALKVRGTLSRPVHKNDDRDLTFNQTAEGSFSADLAPSLSGAFIADVEVRKGRSDTLVWRSRRRIWIKP